MNRKVLIALAVTTFVFGLALLLYPKVNGALLDRQIDEAAQSVVTWILQERESAVDHGTGTDANAVSDTSAAAAERNYAALWEDILAYNRKIYEDGQRALNDKSVYEQPSFDLRAYGVDCDAIGVLQLPTLDLQLPIYLGASEDNMALGAAHLSQTSLPIGGQNTNSVIVGHCGWKGATMFRHLSSLQVGDSVTVVNLWDTLTYTVVEKEILQPYDISKVLIRPDRDMLTLVTCYGRGGKQRIAVYCERAA